MALQQCAESAMMDLAGSRDLVQVEAGVRGNWRASRFRQGDAEAPSWWRDNAGVASLCRRRTQQRPRSSTVDCPILLRRCFCF